MNKEGIKAVRFCMGFNTDLRVKLDDRKMGKGFKPYSESVEEFLEKNLYGIYGCCLYEKLGINQNVDSQTVISAKLHSFLHREALDICFGVERDNFPQLRKD